MALKLKLPSKKRPRKGTLPLPSAALLPPLPQTQADDDSSDSSDESEPIISHSKAAQPPKSPISESPSKSRIKMPKSKKEKIKRNSVSPPPAFLALQNVLKSERNRAKQNRQQKGSKKTRKVKVKGRKAKGTGNRRGNAAKIADYLTGEGSDQMGDTYEIHRSKRDWYRSRFAKYYRHLPKDLQSKYTVDSVLDPSLNGNDGRKKRKLNEMFSSDISLFDDDDEDEEDHGQSVDRMMDVDGGDSSSIVRIEEERGHQSPKREGSLSIASNAIDKLDTDSLKMFCLQPIEQPPWKEIQVSYAFLPKRPVPLDMGQLINSQKKDPYNTGVNQSGQSSSPQSPRKTAIELPEYLKWLTDGEDGSVSANVGLSDSTDKCKEKESSPTVKLAGDVVRRAFEESERKKLLNYLDSVCAFYYSRFLFHCSALVRAERKHFRHCSERTGMGILMKEIPDEYLDRFLAVKPPLDWPSELSVKYWYQRYRWFSKFDLGIQMDKESWYSVTSEKIANNISNRIFKNGKVKVIADLMCGIGGNSISFARHCQLVYSSDIDDMKLKMAKHNAKVYNVDHKIEFMCLDILNNLPFLHNRQVDCIYCAPPWGGPAYMNSIYDLSRKVCNINVMLLFRRLERICQRIVLTLPKNCDFQQVRSLSQTGLPCQIVSDKLHGKIKSITAYFGHF